VLESGRNTGIDEESRVKVGCGGEGVEKQGDGEKQGKKE
jgi:hypothetical protein